MLDNLFSSMEFGSDVDPEVMAEVMAKMRRELGAEVHQQLREGGGRAGRDGDASGAALAALAEQISSGMALGGDDRPPHRGGFIW